MSEPEKPTIHQALSAVMGAVQSISKDSRNTSQNFNFRGIDAVMNAVGPALREHGVVVVPVGVTGESENYATSKGTAMKNVTLTVRYRFYGPAGDFIEATARGEAADSGDKATPKAHSVAFRTLLLQALCIPTDEPDADASSHERRVDTVAQTQAPSSWEDIIARMKELLGDEEAMEWLTQAKELKEMGALTPQPTLAQRLAGAVTDLSEEGHDYQFAPGVRAVVAEIFAARLDGNLLDGPEWYLGPGDDEGRPLKEAWIAAQTEGAANG